MGIGGSRPAKAENPEVFGTGISSFEKELILWTENCMTG